MLLMNDRTGVMRHDDAGYEIARDAPASTARMRILKD